MKEMHELEYTKDASSWPGFTSRRNRDVDMIGTSTFQIRGGLVLHRGISWLQLGMIALVTLPCNYTFFSRPIQLSNIFIQFLPFRIFQEGFQQGLSCWHVRKNDHSGSWMYFDYCCCVHSSIYRAEWDPAG